VAGWLPTAMRSPHLLIAKATAEVHYRHAERDKSMPPEAIAELGRVLEESGLIYVNEVYEGTTHGYTMADALRRGCH